MRIKVELSTGKTITKNVYSVIHRDDGNGALHAHDEDGILILRVPVHHLVSFERLKESEEEDD